jgi:hypothetical protein
MRGLVGPWHGHSRSMDGLLISHAGARRLDLSLPSGMRSVFGGPC